ncbi:unnamed protein product [Ranitomeya imitator]|uniref:G-protein coupled receptors family 1 profile domain-containing protein n=1 Tax=Ranitomeya imitator TaxID=111125 RepID=A0ABN9MPR4_9NEOB|nr:unnamed protein product [Ranitomeya imitator]
MDNITSVPIGKNSCTFHEEFKQILLPVVYSVVLVFGFPLNFIVILQVCFSRKALTRTAIYTLNLAVADFLYVCSLPLLIYNYVHHDYWPFGDFTCRFVRFQFYTNLHGSCYCAMTKILCLKDNLSDVVVRRRKDKAIRMIIIVVIVFAISFFPFHLTKTIYLVVRSKSGVPCLELQTFAIVYKCTRPFASMNSVLDPILFYFTQQKFRQSTKLLVKRVTTKWRSEATNTQK